MEGGKVSLAAQSAADARGRAVCTDLGRCWTTRHSFWLAVNIKPCCELCGASSRLWASGAPDKCTLSRLSNDLMLPSMKPRRRSTVNPYVCQAMDTEEIG